MDTITVAQTCDDAPLVRLLASISTLSRALRMHWLVSVGVEPGQDMLLDHLDVDEPICVSSLADRLQVRPSTVSKMVDRTVSKGWCERGTLGPDRRRTSIRLTREGLLKRTEVRQAFARGEDELARTIQPNSNEVVLRYLKDVNDALRRRVDRVR